MRSMMSTGEQLRHAENTIRVLERENDNLKKALHNKQIMQNLLYSSLQGTSIGAMSAYETELRLLASQVEPDQKMKVEIMTKIGLIAAESAFAAASATYEILVADQKEDERQTNEENQKASVEKPSGTEAETPN